MHPSRRDVLRGSGYAAILGLGLATAGCSTAVPSSSPSSGGDTALWYWGGGLSDAVVQDAVTHFQDRTTIRPAKIDGDFRTSLNAAFGGGSAVPAITGVKGEDMPHFRATPERFVDLNSLGAQDLITQGLGWKWREAQTFDGKQIGFPIDIGPTAMFYRADLFDRAGLPSDPAAVSAAITTWGDFYDLGQELHGRLPRTYPVGQLYNIWLMTIGQTQNRFVSADDRFIGDSDELHDAWRIAVRAQALGINAGSTDTAADLVSGRIAVDFGPAWHALDIADAAPATTGRWRVASNPVKPTNRGGSFLTIPAATKDPQQAFEIIRWILSPDNEAKGFTDAAIFPADPAAWTSPALTAGDPFFGGQRTIDVFGPAGRLVPSQYHAPTDDVVAAPYGAELAKVETAGKDPDAAWRDAVAAGRQIAKQHGVE